MRCKLKTLKVLATAATVASVAVPQRLDARQEVPRFDLRLWPHGLVSATAAIGTVLAEGFGSELPYATCAPCDRSSLPGFDRVALGPERRAVSRLSDALLVGTTAAAGLFLLSERAGSHAAAREDVAVLAQAVSVSAALTTLLKVIVSRPRPVRYDSVAAAFADAGDGRSFPSHHAGIAAAAAATYIAIHHRRGDLREHRGRALLLAGAAVLTGSLRVAGRRHFPSDVAAGLGLGAITGWLYTTSVPLR